jgi:hypothetical protein
MFSKKGEFASCLQAEKQEDKGSISSVCCILISFSSKAVIMSKRHILG